ncbi:MAG TPA: hypothetical protein VGS97_14605 [Actinocrinis sp.]|uniref:hypothetical protein n=1 Tax=Actinocrinis sp. TaxID=1920516 RepID=UPI002DDCAF8E|nr:hypothetical protein [Actinocrinis sp.]HEV2345327.1 hypothetical protein [Actinocrinis sp.]
MDVLTRSPDEPIFAETARKWRLAGRIVPGEQDATWDRLVRPDSGHADSDGVAGQSA